MAETANQLAIDGELPIEQLATLINIAVAKYPGTKVKINRNMLMIRVPDPRISIVTLSDIVIPEPEPEECGTHLKSCDDGCCNACEQQ